MAGKKKTIRLLGQTSGRPVGIKTFHEAWSEVELTDGTTLRLRPIVTQVFRATDQRGKNLQGPDKGPVYHIQASIMIVPVRKKR